jgi:hypothetical protein
METIYIFDIIVVIILVADFYMRFKESEEKGKVHFKALIWNTCLRMNQQKIDQLTERNS